MFRTNPLWMGFPLPQSSRRLSYRSSDTASDERPRATLHLNLAGHLEFNPLGVDYPRIKVDHLQLCRTDYSFEGMGSVSLMIFVFLVISIFWQTISKRCLLRSSFRPPAWSAAAIYWPQTKPTRVERTGISLADLLF
jgi:hypothetical protein